MNREFASESDRRGNPWLVLAAFLMVVYMVGALASLASGIDVRNWYGELQKPGFAPPAWVFGPVWFVLYGLMALAAWLVWKAPDDHPARRPALLLFVGQLLLNGTWSPAFFGLRNPELGLAVVLALATAVALTIRWFWRVDMRAGVVLLPYFAWVGFAAALNAGIAVLN